MEFKTSKGRPSPRTESETVITYDAELKKWFIYTNHAPHARKWENKIIPSDDVSSRKVYHEDTGKLIAIEGEIKGSVGVRGPKKMTEKQKEQATKRLLKNVHGIES
ncbi:hypothetical protein ACWOE5_09455 [Aerococcus sanguinicola]|uniref:Uncharacterized protein n=1 Tax=Aerococcus sanguinicola TaxID=119206 RepID=A0A0X8FBR8_9LACT|nr:MULTISPECIES: hypothetical protein [Aerococcus]AMB94411.1 hypothetical protein AWM72_06365 [Aerococcus sanguinicola]MDK7051095.1 hypothetical protein [Aerococcus sanguinicola]OFT94081.1 hypothetical protein HMPREF3090_06065 [Aerococcus sp. HMSC23C02]PKZ20734.1 hypothetical protein CYJ28_09630 [Aerococcus sanguinicola]